MSTIAVIAVGLAAFSFFAWHGIVVYFDDKDKERRSEEWKRTKKELDDEIRNGGNVARIVALRLRLRKLED